MASQLELVQEAVKRGLPLPPEKQALYDEAVKRGLIQDARVSTASDVGWSALSSVPKAISGIAGVGADLSDALYGGMAYGVERLGGKTPEEAGAKKDEAIKSRQEMRQGMAETGLGAVTGITPGSAAIRKGIEDKFTGPLYDPRTVPGEYADTTGQFLTGALAFGAGGFIPRVLQGVIPGLVTETTGQVTREVAPEWENTARTVAGLGSSLLTNVATSAKSVNKVLADATKGATKEQINKAIILMQESHQAGGVPLTFPEAVQHVTNGATTLDDIARFVENSRHGGSTMREFYSKRPQQVESAFNAKANTLDPSPGMPEVVGPRAQQAAEQSIDRTRQAINARTKPLYDAANPVRLKGAEAAQIIKSPLYKQKVAELRSHPYLGDHYKRVKADSVEMVDAVKKLLDAEGEALAINPQGLDRFAQANVTKQKQKMVDVATGQSKEYETALTEQARLRQQYLNPLESGPTGKVAASSDIGAQTRAIFPSAPASNSEVGVTKAIKALVKKDPQLAANVVGKHIDNIFNEATQDLPAGPNQAGGARFAAFIAGNKQQAKNLEAAIRALEGGDSKWIGFQKLLDNLRATGRRKPVGSPTDMNQAIRQDLAAGGPVGTSLAALTSPGRLSTRMMDTYQAWRLGRNSEELARLFTDPRASDELSRLAVLKPGSKDWVATVSRITERVVDTSSPFGRAELITRSGPIQDQ